jgi:hypothetical protein
MDWILNLKNLAEAIGIAIDGVIHTRERLNKAKLENKAREQEIKLALQKADNENKIALLEQEKQKLQIERMRLELFVKQCQVTEYKLDFAHSIVSRLYFDADKEMRAMLLQNILSLLLKSQNSSELELALQATSQNSEEEEADRV